MGTVKCKTPECKCTLKDQFNEVKNSSEWKCSECLRKIKDRELGDALSAHLNPPPQIQAPKTKKTKTR